MPDEIKFPCKSERLTVFLDDAITLLGVDKQGSPEMVMALSLLPQDFAHRLAAYDRETTAKEEKRIAAKIKTHADALAKLLEDAPERVKNHLGFWIGGLEHRQPGAPFEPDSRWQIRKPRTIDTAQLYIGALGQLAGAFAGASLPQPAVSPQQWLVNRAVELALKSHKTKEDGLALAKMGYFAVAGHEPREEEWGVHAKKRKIKG